MLLQCMSSSHNDTPTDILEHVLLPVATEDDALATVTTPTQTAQTKCGITSW